MSTEKNQQIQRISGLDALAAEISLSDDIAPLGASVIKAAEDRSYEMPELLATMMLLKPIDLPLLDEKAGTETWVKFIPGHTVEGSWGPAHGVETMIVGKMPWRSEIRERKLFAGESGKLWKEVLTAAGVDYSTWYLTNIVRFMPPGRRKSLLAGWLKECRWFFDQEVAIMKPKNIMLFGADAIKAVMGRKASLDKLRGVEGLEYKGARVVVTTHPAAVAIDPNLMEGFSDDLRYFASLTSRAAGYKKKPVNYNVLRSADELSAVIDDLEEREVEELSVDCEWGSTERSDWIHGELRSMQFSPKVQEAYCIALRGPGLVPTFEPNIDAAWVQIKRLMALIKRIIGHNFRSDVKWFIRHRVNVIPQMLAGFDTCLGFHLLNPIQGKGLRLENLAVKYTDLGRYDWELQKWLDKNGLGKKQLRIVGYADVPDELLHPYGMADVDGPMRMAPLFIHDLKDTQFEAYGAWDYCGKTMSTLYDLYREVVHPVNLPIDELEREGFPTDVQRLKDLVYLFKGQREKMIEEFRTTIGWPSFNFRSVNQVREFLYGYETTVAMLAAERGADFRTLRPEGATCVHLTPIKTTEKPSRDWDRVQEEELPFVNASTDSETLKILANGAPEARSLSELRFVDQQIKNFLRLPDEDDDGEAMVDENTGEEVYSTGLVGAVDPDNRIRTSISQLTDTGRYRCVSGDTILETSKGSIRIDSIDLTKHEELLILTHKGRLRKIVDHVCKGKEHMYEVTTESGKIICCTEKHRFRCGQAWKDLRSFKVGDTITAVRTKVCSGCNERRDSYADTYRSLFPRPRRRGKDEYGLCEGTRSLRGSSEQIHAGVGGEARKPYQATAAQALFSCNERKNAKETATSLCAAGQRSVEPSCKRGSGCLSNSTSAANDNVPRSKEYVLLRDRGEREDKTRPLCVSSSFACREAGSGISRPKEGCSRVYRRQSRLLRQALRGIPQCSGYEICHPRVEESSQLPCRERRVGEESHCVGGQPRRDTNVNGAAEEQDSACKRRADRSILCRLPDRKACSRGGRNVPRGCARSRKGQKRSRASTVSRLRAAAVHVSRGRKRRRSLCKVDSRFFDDRIISITRAGTREVWDITVEDDESYVAHGLVHHNSSEPNLMNLPKKQETQLKKIFSLDREAMMSIEGWDGLDVSILKDKGLLNPGYFPLRTCFIAPPGEVLIEADYVQAELEVLANLSGDSNLKAVMADPERDLHSEIAIRGLRLACLPNQVKKLFPTKRDAAKAVVYGIAYGRGSYAIVRGMLQEGITAFTTEDADRMKDALFGECPLVYEYIEKTQALVFDPGFVENPYGRRRYFPYTDDEKVRAEQQRQAVNMPIQGTVADALTVALINLYHYKRSVDPSLSYKVLLPVHDAVLLSVPVDQVDQVVNEVLPICMCEVAKVPHIGLTFKLDISATLRWGQKMTMEEAIAGARAMRRVA